MADIDNEKIESFSETVTVSDDTKKKELDAADEQTEEKEEERAEDLGESVDTGLSNEEETEFEELRQRMELKLSRMDYGTPAGVDDGPDGGCSTCGTTAGNADAADAAIIDAEIAPAQGSPDTGEEIGGEATPDLGTGEENEGLGEEIMQFTQWHMAFGYYFLDERLDNPMLIAQCEDFSWGGLFSKAIDSLVGLLGSIMSKVAGYLLRVYKFARKRISATFFRLQTVQKLWNVKLSARLNLVSDNALRSYEIEAFPYPDWIDAAKLSLVAFEMAHNADQLVFDPSKDMLNANMRTLKQSMKQIGINIDVQHNRMNVNDFLDKRQFKSIADLGYSRSQAPNCMRYFGEMSKRVPKGDLNTLEGTMKHVTDRLTQASMKVNQAVEAGRLKKQSPEYRDEVDRIFKYTVRFDFILTCMKAAYYLFDILSADALKVFEKYEDAIDSWKEPEPTPADMTY